MHFKKFAINGFRYFLGPFFYQKGNMFTKARKEELASNEKLEYLLVDVLF